MGMKRENGYGSITKMRDKNRRRPYRVRITIGWELGEDKAIQKVKTLGCFKSLKEAEEALAEFNKCPYDLTHKEMTFEDIYNVWSEEYFNKLKKISSERTIKSAYSYCSGLYKMRMRDIRSHHLKDCMDKGYVIPTVGKDKGKKRFATANTKARIKSLFNLMFDYAYEHEVVDRNYARAFKISEDILEEKKQEQKPRIPFSNEEIEKLWDNVDKVKFVDMILIEIYTGFRPQELAILELKNVDIENGWIMGGLKTKAGIDRYVPIHPLIKDLVVNRYNDAKELGSEYLFNDLEGQQGTYMTYDKYRKRFDKAMMRLGMSHRPHETRHTFVSLCKDYGVDEYSLKKIVGHSTGDITEFVYTHQAKAKLAEEIRKVQKFRKSDEDYNINW